MPEEYVLDPGLEEEDLVHITGFFPVVHRLVLNIKARELDHKICLFN